MAGMLVAKPRLDAGVLTGAGQGDANPVPLEAFLRTEIAVLDPQLQTSRALQRACVVIAVGAEALAFRRRFVGHGESGYLWPALCCEDCEM